MKPIATLLLAAAAMFPADLSIHIPFEKYKLPNGLRVVLARDTSVPVVAVYVVYDVGARMEEKDRTGFAHLFEHMMFEGSANVKKGELFTYVSASGGEANGSTHFDYTDFYETLPSNKLALGLWLESDRMSGLTITEENLKIQKDAAQQAFVGDRIQVGPGLGGETQPTGGGAIQNIGERSHAKQRRRQRVPAGYDVIYHHGSQE